MFLDWHNVQKSVTQIIYLGPLHKSQGLRPLQIPLLNLKGRFPELQTLDTGCVAAQFLLDVPIQHVEHCVVTGQAK